MMCLAKIYVVAIILCKRQSLNSNDDANADTNTNADAEMPMQSFLNAR